MKRKSNIFVSVLLCFSLLFANLSAIPVFAYSGYFDGDGTEASPYIISTSQQLVQLADLVNGGDTSYNSKYYRMANDIDLSTIANWTPIGTNDSYPFSGTFDGNGFKLMDITIKYTNTSSLAKYFGLFGYNKGVIKNIEGIDGTIAIDGSGGGINTGCIAGYNSGTLSNCYADGTISGGLNHAGGIVGENYGIIDNCSSKVNISYTSFSNYISGGIAGINRGTIDLCYNTGKISGSDYSGGITGDNSSGTINSSYNAGTVATIDFGSMAAGIAGNNSNGIIKDCFNTGYFNAGNAGTCAGGITGSSAGTISNCYNIGPGWGETGGGIAGKSTTPITNSYYINTAYRGIGSGTDTTTSCTIEQLQQQATYAGFDFDNVWEIKPDSLFKYPTIRLLPMVSLTVQFDTQGGSTIDPYTVAPDDLISEPAAPTRANCIFNGWYKETAYYNLWNFSKDRVAADTTLYAKWTRLVTGVSLDKSAATIKTGEFTTLTATVNPNDASNKGITWSSSDTTVATVDNYGKVTAVGAGTAAITVKTTDGGYTADCILTVIQSNEKPVISGETDKTLYVGDSFNPGWGIDVTDYEDGDLKSKLIVSGNVDTTKVGQYKVTYTVTDSDGNTTSITGTINVIARNVQVLSLVGTNRYDTAARLSQSQFGFAGTIVIVNGSAMADGLGATPLAKYKNAPLLLTDKYTIPEETAREIRRLMARHAIIVGGTGVVSNNVDYQLQGAGLTVERISGKDRYGTSLEVAKYIDENCYDVSKVVVSNGNGEADALSIASVAGRDNMPIILVGKDSIPDETYSWLKSEDLQDAYIIGGSGVVSDNVLNKIDAITSNDITGNRLGGSNRFETNSQIIDRFYGSVFNRVYIAKGYVLIDALAAGPVAALDCAPVVLTGSDLTASQKAVLGKRYGNWILRTGGGISDTAVNSLKQCLK